MKNIYVCGCGCPRLRRDADVGVNDESDVNTYDSISCPECSYDGHWYYQIEVEDDFDLDTDLDPEHVKENGVFVAI